MILFASGLTIGLVIGLTGAGGALVALPLFMEFLSLSIKEASVLSLVAVGIASGINFFFQKRHAQVGISMALFIPSLLGSYAVSGVKKDLPQVVIQILVASISLYALYSVWRPTIVSVPERRSLPLIVSFPVGFFLGVLTTLTGLGGGVLLMPLLLTVFSLPQNNAVATGLAVICLSSFSSLLIQFSSAGAILVPEDILTLSAGIITTSVFLMFVSKTFSPSLLNKTRQGIFTLVVILSLLKILQ